MKEGSRVAVLGSTPEFRDLLFEIGFDEVYVFDRSQTFYEQMSDYRVYSNNEWFVRGDWIDALASYKDSFSLMLSDLTSGNVPYESRKRFYELISRSLCPSGLFIDKNLTQESQLLTISEIAEKYRELQINIRTINDFSCDAIFCSEFQLERGVIDTNEVYDRLLGSFENPRLRRFIVESEFITPRNCHWYYGVPWTRIQNVYCPNLELVEKVDFPLYSPYRGRGFQFVWRKE